MKRVLLLFILMIIQVGLLRAQAGTEDLLKIKLPPIDSLFNGAMKTSMFQFYDYKMQQEQYILKTEKRRWLEFFSVFGSYQYGAVGVNSFTNYGSEFPLVYQTSGEVQLWYNVGAMLRIPLDRLFDRGNRVKSQKAKMNATLKERDLWYDEQKIKIIDLYVKVEEMLNNLDYVVEHFALIDEQYEIAQKDYAIGSMNGQTLGVIKGAQVQAYMQLERVKAELNAAILKLEILSNTKIINR
ncbi:MAG: TolC family protein [Bacteroidales bacterium]|nr:TolC family protein [Bacteroidales bacterium]